MNDTAQTIERLAHRLGSALRAQHLMLATAESCTAGGVGYAITIVPGSSGWYDRGFITYSNEAKMQMLGVSSAYLRDFGAVSEPVARAMALGALSHGAHVSLAVTGIAGPDGGSSSKPVGTVCFAWAIRRDSSSAPWVKTQTVHIAGDRNAVRTQSIVVALRNTDRIARAARGHLSAGLFPGFAQQTRRANGIDIHLRLGGNGPPLLLLHGFPQTHVIWHKVAPQLAKRYTLVMPDLRGYGDSDKPPSAADHAPYSKRTMALDVVELMRSLGFERFFVCGHDRGGRVAHRLALDHPQCVVAFNGARHLADADDV